MTESVCLVMPAATLAAPTPSPAGRRQAACDRDRAAVSLATAETRLREVEARARARAGTRAGPSNEAIVARARALMAESGGTLNVIEAVDRAHAEARAGIEARLAGALDGVTGAADRLDAGIAAAMEAQLLEWARRAIAEAQRKLEDGLPPDAGGSLDGESAACMGVAGRLHGQ